jgi:hypothetical protein
MGSNFYQFRVAKVNVSTFSNRRPPLSTYKNPDILCAIDDHHLVDMTEMARRQENARVLNEFSHQFS